MSLVHRQQVGMSERINVRLYVTIGVACTIACAISLRGALSVLEQAPSHTHSRLCAAPGYAHVGSNPESNGRLVVRKITLEVKQPWGTYTLCNVGYVHDTRHTRHTRHTTHRIHVARRTTTCLLTHTHVVRCQRPSHASSS